MERHIRITKSSLKQRILSFAVVYMVSFLGILNCINAITNEIGFNTSLDTVMCYGVLFLSVLASFSVILFSNKIKIDVMILVVAIFFAYIYTYAMYPKNTEYFFTNIMDIMDNPLYMFVIYSVPGYVFVRYITDYKYLKKYMLYFAYFVVTISAIVNLFIPDSSANQYMTLSYNMLAQVAFLIMYKPKKNKILHYIFIVVGSFVIAVGGSRGALVGLLLEVVFLLIYNNYSRKVKGILFSILATLSLIVVFFYEKIILGLSMWLRVNDLDSRTLELFLESGGDITSGRLKIQSFLLSKWTILGNGLYADRVLLKDSLLFSKDITYAHNLFVEWIVDFGVVIGSALTIGFLIMLFLGMKNRLAPEFVFILIFISTGFVELMFSGSYLGQSVSFYILCGLCVSSIKRKHLPNRLTDSAHFRV